MTESLKKQKEEFEKQALEASRKALINIKKGGQNYMVKKPGPASPAPPPEEELADTTMALPQPTAAMFPGLVGELARAASDRNEVNPVAAAMNYLSFLSAMCGRDVYFAIGDTFHHPRLFTLHVGRSSLGGKGESMELVGRIRAEIAAQDAQLLGRVHTGGLSSREGLAHLIHDGYKMGKEEFPPIDDKRLWVVESEFANVLHQAKRDGNTLSPAIRDLWDGKSIQPATKNSRIWATDPHVAIAAGITPGELHSVIHARELSNGFANRFLMFWSERTGDVANPVPTPWAVVDGLATRTAEVIRFALGEYPATADSRQMHRTAEANQFFESIYPALRRPAESEALSSLLARRAPYLCRLSLLFALCDLSMVVELKHLQAAKAWIDYCSASVGYLFAAQAREVRTLLREEMAAKIMEFLEKNPAGASITGFVEQCFNKHTPPLPICEVLTWMLADQRFKHLEMREIPRKDGKPGRPSKVYRLNRHPRPGS